MNDFKRCNHCTKYKPRNDFYRRIERSKRGSGLQAHCKVCQAETMVKTHKRWKDNRERMQDWIEDKYSGIPCMDCNIVFKWVAMDFDHRPEEIKSFCIGNHGSYKASPKAIAKVEKEIAKCDLVCSNCHRIRTWITRKK